MINKRANMTAAGTQPIPGYTLKKRLGAGGYGEVWLTDAPGGLQKAVKLIYGTIEDSRAANELRSLERIRNAHHPFLLSLERIEVVEGKVVIVTELAESSLQDRFQVSRRQGLPGIPRAQLLEFLRDSADALDYLASKFSLQHLDVKPGNLLIIADHIKVADFGLVKDLHDPNHSLVSGLTPTYSAPEVFDGKPDFRSDQYSLAIVYMEMLTGQLPFQGRTPGELARQHLTQAPNLECLPPADRGIVLRALSKNPLDRYATCRQFIDQLLKVRGAVVVPSLDHSDRIGKEESSSKQVLVTDTRNWSTDKKQSFAKARSIKQFAKDWNTPRAMFVGVGGQGVLALRELRSDLLHNVDHRLTSDEYGWLAIDTSQEELDIAVKGRKLERIPHDSAIYMPVQSPHTYRKIAPELFTPLSRRWLYNIPKSLKTDGVRPIATLALIAHYPALYRIVESKLMALMQSHQADQDCNSPLAIYLTGSLHGGTGSALLAEIGQMVRIVFSKHGFKNYRICAVVSAATTVNSQAGANLHAANAIVTLSELRYLMQACKEVPRLDYRAGVVMSGETPFDWITVVYGGLFDDRDALARNPKNLARCISLDCQTLCAAVLRDSRLENRNEANGWLRSMRCHSVHTKACSTAETLSRIICSDLLAFMVDYLGSNHSSDTQDRIAPTTLSSSPRTISSNMMPRQSSDELVKKSLRELSIAIPDSEEQFQLWFARLSASSGASSSQFDADVSYWHKLICRQIHARFLNWNQLEKMQLEFIQGLFDFYDRQSLVLNEKLGSFKDPLSKKTDIPQATENYLRQFIQACVNIHETARQVGMSFKEKISHWRSSIFDKSEALHDDARACFDELSPQAKLLYTHVREILENMLFDELVGQVDVAFKNSSQNESTAPESTIDELELLVRAHQMVLQKCKELAIDSNDLECQLYHHSVISFNEIDGELPDLADGGGEIARIIITNEQQLPQVEQAVAKFNIASTTTLIPGSISMGTHLVNDAVKINLPHIVATLWRPSGATLSLAERLRTRVDIDWHEVADMLTCNLPIPDQAAKVDTGISDENHCESDSVSIQIVPQLNIPPHGQQPALP